MGIFSIFVISTVHYQPNKSQVQTPV
ncbi:TPA: ErmCL family antibiotic resistance leader peptide [Staphylococcus aureus]|nr:ErmCL family antibiotic resistance leader peptide [Staphylococcus aureus]HAR6737494.1 ErmCL family antibiotic resistance leader peptide [Staphylococcus aureus]